MPESNLIPEHPTEPPAAEGQLAAVLPLRDIVVFPHMIVPLFVGREKSVRALEEVMTEEKQILLLTQKNAGEALTTSRMKSRSRSSSTRLARSSV